MPSRLPRGTPIEQRFWHYVDKQGPNDHWLWIGGQNTAGWHGSFIEVHNKVRTKHYAHRYSWQLHNGPIPDGLRVLHRCDIPQCVNPNHLFLGTQSDNVADMDAKGRRGSNRGKPHRTKEEQ